MPAGRQGQAGPATTLPSLSGLHPPRCQSSRRARAPTMTYAFSRRRRKHHNTPTLPASDHVHVRTQPKFREGQRDSADTTLSSMVDASSSARRRRHGRSVARTVRTERETACGRAGGPGRLEWPSRRVDHTSSSSAEHVGGRPSGGCRPTRTCPSPRALSSRRHPPAQPTFCPAGSSSSPAFLVSGQTNRTPRRKATGRAHDTSERARPSCCSATAKQA